MSTSVVALQGSRIRHWTMCFTFAILRIAYNGTPKPRDEHRKIHSIFPPFPIQMRLVFLLLASALVAHVSDASKLRLERGSPALDGLVFSLATRHAGSKCVPTRNSPLSTSNAA
eukprot:scaffold300_cov258-Pinguiococcus_pyrenoidosus.AAC.28